MATFKALGANNNTIGRQATVDVFLAIAEIVDGYVEKRDEGKLVVRNSAEGAS